MNTELDNLGGMAAKKGMTLLRTLHSPKAEVFDSNMRLPNFSAWKLIFINNIIGLQYQQ